MASKFLSNSWQVILSTPLAASFRNWNTEFNFYLMPASLVALPRQTEGFVLNHEEKNSWPLSRASNPQTTMAHRAIRSPDRRRAGSIGPVRPWLRVPRTKPGVFLPSQSQPARTCIVCEAHDLGIASIDGVEQAKPIAGIVLCGTKPFRGRQEPMRRTASRDYACRINVIQRPCLNLDRKMLAAAAGLVVLSGAICGICERRARWRSPVYENHLAAFVSGPERSATTFARR